MVSVEKLAGSHLKKRLNCLDEVGLIVESAVLCEFRQGFLIAMKEQVCNDVYLSGPGEEFWCQTRD